MHARTYVRLWISVAAVYVPAAVPVPVPGGGFDTGAHVLLRAGRAGGGGGRGDLGRAGTEAAVETGTETGCGQAQNPLYNKSDFF